MSRMSSTKENDSVVCGAIFAAIRGATQERAEVLGVAKDGLGIPHVRYQLELHRAGNCSSVGQRTLALNSFCDRYRHAQGGAEASA